MTTIRKKIHQIFAENDPNLKDYVNKTILEIIKNNRYNELNYDDYGKLFHSKSINGVAIMLKRQYGSTSLSPTCLKGSDCALYNSLKNDFHLEIKQIILQQFTNDDGNYLPYQIIALSGMEKLKTAYSSDEEKQEQPKKDSELKKEQEEVSKNEEKPKHLQTIALVAGFSNKSLTKVDSQTGQKEVQEGYNVYMNAALFIYPKI